MDETQAHTAHQEVTTSAFADSDLGRIQGILLGDHARRMDDRFSTLEQALTGAISDLRAEMQQSIEELGRQVRSEQTNRSTAMRNLGERIDTETELRSEGESALIGKLDGAESTLRNIIATERSAVAGELQREVASMRERSIDKRDLAALFSETAEKLLNE